MSATKTTWAVETGPVCGGVGLIARDDGRPVGYLTYSTRWGDEDYEVHVEEVEVKPSHRRRGVASALLAHLREMYPGDKILGGDFTRDGAAWWKAATGESVRATHRVAPGSGGWNDGD